MLAWSGKSVFSEFWVGFEIVSWAATVAFRRRARGFTSRGVIRIKLKMLYYYCVISWRGMVTDIDRPLPMTSLEPAPASLRAVLKGTYIKSVHVVAPHCPIDRFDRAQAYGEIRESRMLRRQFDRSHCPISRHSVVSVLAPMNNERWPHDATAVLRSAVRAPMSGPSPSTCSGGTISSP